MKHRKRSHCPIANTLDMVGDRWTLLVVRDLMHGCAHFSEFASAPEQIATDILSDRLSRLTLHGLVQKTTSPADAGCDCYRLTEKGRALCRVVSALTGWKSDQCSRADSETVLN